jgi:hypothetical protein
MYTVEEIGDEEIALQKRMPVDGHIEHRDKYLADNGLYDEWRNIYKKYVALAQKGDLEALKRALFFSWYQLAGQEWLSGIGKLPDDQTQIVVNLLEELLSKNMEDHEIALMLPYYMAVCDYYLERFYPLPHIQKASVSTADQGRPALVSDKWTHRGEMGKYWASV